MAFPQETHELSESHCDFICHLLLLQIPLNSVPRVSYHASQIERIIVTFSCHLASDQKCITKVQQQLQWAEQV